MNRHARFSGRAERGDGANRPAGGHWMRRLIGSVRRSLARPSPVTLEGAIFITLSVLIGLAATNTGTNLLYLIFALMMALLLVSGILSARTLKKLSAQRSFPKHIVAGEPVDVRLTLRNDKRFCSSYGLQISDLMDDATVAGYAYFVSVGSRDRASVSYPCVFHRRGLYRFAELVVATTYPFGFVRRSVVVKATQEVLVYPQILPWNQVGLETPPDFGERDSRQKGLGTSLYGIREQHPNEGARWIHWKKTAQTEKLMRREFEAEEKKNVSLVLDNVLQHPDSPEMRQAFERAIVLTASAAHHLLRTEHQVELVTRSGRIPFNAGPHQRYRILRALALVEPAEAGADAPMPVGIGGDAATVVFCCEGHHAARAYPRGTQVVVVPAAGSETPRALRITAAEPEVAVR